MPSSLVGLVADIAHKWPLQEFLSVVIHQLSETPQDGQVGRTLQIQYETGYLSLVVVLETNIAEGLENVAALVQTMRSADKSDDSASFGGFVEYHFRVRCRNNLGLAFGCGTTQQFICLALSQNFQVGVGLIQKNDASRMQCNE